MNKHFIIIASFFFFSACTGEASKKSISANTVSDTDGKMVVPKIGKVSLIQDSFTFITPDNKQGFFVYPQSNLSLFKNHFFVQINSGDTMICGLMQKKKSKKTLTIKAELTETYKGDISHIAKYCSGQNATLTVSDGKNTKTIDTKILDKYKKFKTPRLIFPYIPSFGFLLKDVASPTSDEIKLIAKIEFFDRVSKSTITNCTYYSIDGIENSDCFAVPMIYPETVFYGKVYRSLQMHSIRANIEYLDKVVE